MLESALLHLNDSPSGEQAIEVSVNLARRHRARVRGLTLLDTRPLESVLVQSEAAIFASEELGSLNRCEHTQSAIRTRFCQACLTAGVDFDVRSVRADPREVFSREARFHDLLLAGCPAPGADHDDDPAAAFRPRELVDVLIRSGRPMLIVRGLELRRVLLVCDGSAASTRAIRSFRQQNLFPDAECRLLAVGGTQEQAREILREMVPDVRSREPSLEIGCIQGRTQRVVVQYAQKWRADLVVLGVDGGNRVLRRLVGEAAHKVLTKTPCALYAAG